MSGYNAKNYTEQGGDVTHIGGKLIFEEGSSVEGLPSSFTPAENQVDSEAATIAALKEDFNSLLGKLKTAGIMTADADENAGTE
ncbi:MAG: Head fiber protein [Hungatella sp.]|nr:Head fiber protein [Hungatella sp.]